MEDRTEENKGKTVQRWMWIFPALLFVAGIAVFLYPYLSDRLYQKDVEAHKEKFESQVDREEDSLEKLYQELKRRNEKLYQSHQQELADPFAYEQPDIDLSEYGLEGNTIGFIKIPRMQVTLPVLLGANQENMSLGAVHLTETSYPIGGTNTNSVIAAHRGYSRTAMFRDIEALEIGDEVIIENFRETLIYEVADLRVILPKEVDQLMIQEGKDMVTLMTCHPYRHNYQRYVVFCVRKSHSPKKS